MPRQQLTRAAGTALGAFLACLACESIDTTPETNVGSGGTSSAGSSSMAAGTGGNVAGGGSAGTAGDGSTGGVAPNAGSTGGTVSAPDAGLQGGEVTCRGCIELRIPVTGGSQTAYFNLQLPNAQDFSQGRIIYRLQALTHHRFFTATPFINQSDYGALELGATLPLTEEATRPVTAEGTAETADAGGSEVSDAGLTSAESDGFFELVFDVGEHTSMGIDKGDIILFGLLVGSASAYAEGPATVRLVLESVRLEGVEGVGDLDFTNSNQNFVLNTFVPYPDGSRVIHYD